MNQNSQKKSVKVSQNIDNNKRKELQKAQRKKNYKENAKKVGDIENQQINNTMESPLTNQQGGLGNLKEESFKNQQKKQIEMQEEKFWIRRNNQAAIWILLSCISNLCFQITALANPHSKLFFNVNLAYTAVSFIQFIGAFLNFYKKMHFLNYYNLTILIFRLAIRYYDFENSYESTGSIIWQGILVINLAQSILSFHIQINFCQMDIKKYILSFILFFFFVFSLLYGIQLGYYKEKQMKINFSWFDSAFFQSAIFCSIIFFVFEILCVSLNTELYNNMHSKINKQNEFKFILDHLEEQIIIFNSSEQVDFLNKRFVNCFSEQIEKNNLKNKFSEINSSESNLIDKQISVKEKLASLIKNIVFLFKYYLNFENLDENEDYDSYILNGRSFMKAKLFREIINKNLDQKNMNQENQMIMQKRKQTMKMNSQKKIDLEQCIHDILKTDSKDLNQKIFMVLDEFKEMNENSNTPNRYVQIKRKYFYRDDKLMVMLQVIDISDSILYDNSKAQNEFLSIINATVSHEMRNPLNSICAENIQKQELQDQLRELLLNQNIPIQDKIIQALEIINQMDSSIEVQKASANLLKFMIQDMLDYSQIQNGKFRKNIKKFNIFKTVEMVMSIQRMQAREKNLEFTATFLNIEEQHEEQNIIQKSRKDRIYSPIIETDEQRVMQVLLCLQSNAMKFTQKGSITIQVEIIQIEDAEYLEISVIDTGIGIPYEDQDKLFKLFGFVQDSFNLNQNGIGLGLAISDKIVQNFGGDINFQSTPMQGSTFRFKFQLKKQKNSQDLDQNTQDNQIPIDEAEEDNICHSQEFQIDKVELKDLYFKWQPISDSQSDVNQIEHHFNINALRFFIDNQQSQQIQINRIQSIKLVQDDSFISQIHSEKNFISYNVNNTVYDRPNNILMHKQEIVFRGLDSSISQDSKEVQKHKKILIVDDIGFNIQALQIILKYYVKLNVDLICDKAMNGLEALEMVKKDVENNYNGYDCSYELILMDCNMPIMDGYQASEKIREYLYENGIDQPLIIAVTGHSEQQYVKKAIYSGMNQLFTKPVKGELVKQLVKLVGFTNQSE